MSKDATDEAEKAAEAIGGEESIGVQEEVVQADVHQDYEATEEGANVIGTLRVKVHICQAGNCMPPSG